jgi:hypothetical protein
MPVGSSVSTYTRPGKIWDTTGFTPVGTSVSTYGDQAKFLGYHRLYAGW